MIGPQNYIDKYNHKRAGLVRICAYLYTQREQDTMKHSYRGYMID